MMLSDSSNKGILFFVTFSMLLFAASFSWAAVYTCRDAKGSIHFTNVPSTGGCTKFIKDRPRRTKHSARSYNSSSYDEDIWLIGVRHNVDPYLIKAVIRTESDFNSRAVSKMGAQGLMQLMPETARELQVSDPFDPQENIDGGTRYLRQMLDTFNNDLMLSIAAYNAGPGAVKRAKGVPRIPETLQYVTRVLKHYRGYRKQAKG